MEFIVFLICFIGAAKSEVVDQHFSQCKNFFYKQTPPSGFEEFNELKQICQRYDNRYHFASSHSSDYRIPIFSAYTLDTFSCLTDQPARRSTWFVEPQLADSGLQNDMRTEGRLAARYGEVQAINIDYQNTNFDKGHLNPNFYQCDEGRTATFTLTNAVPQDPCFNQQEWKIMEKRAKQIMENYCSFPGSKRYFVTGVVPSTQTIPSNLHDKEGDRERNYNRVSVPSAMWTAACCDASNANSNDKYKGFSFGYYGDNSADSRTTAVTVSQLESVLNPMYGITSLSIFSDSCELNRTRTISIILNALTNPNLRDRVLDLIKEMRTNEPAKKRRFLDNLQTSLRDNKDLENNIWMLEGIGIGMSEERGKIQDTRNLLAKYNLTTLLSCPDYPNCLDKKISLSYRENRNVKDELRKRDTANLAIPGQNDPLQDAYVIVPSLSSTISASCSRCRHGHPCGLHGETYNWCYTDWNDNWDYCCDDKCGFSGTNYPYCNTGTSWTYCSQRGSMVTVDGVRCRADHECGTHTFSYYWCYTDTSNNWGYCCQPWHPCDRGNGSSDKWCYVGYQKETRKTTCHY